jgi:hypothetical protein
MCSHSCVDLYEVWLEHRNLESAREIFREIKTIEAAQASRSRPASRPVAAIVAPLNYQI